MPRGHTREQARDATCKISILAPLVFGSFGNISPLTVESLLRHFWRDFHGELTEYEHLKPRSQKKFPCMRISYFFFPSESLIWNHLLKSAAKITGLETYKYTDVGQRDRMEK